MVTTLAVFNLPANSTAWWTHAVLPVSAPLISEGCGNRPQMRHINNYKHLQ